MKDTMANQFEKIRDEIIEEDGQSVACRYPKKSFQGLVDTMDGKGITFNDVKPDDARKILQNRNYYFKLTVYKRNFKKNKEGKYINLDFKDLVDIASLDMQLRYLLLKYTLDIEHALKTTLLKSITEDEDDDGYSCVRRFFHSTVGSHKPLDNEVVFKNITKKSHYQYNLAQKYKEQISAWVLLEVISFSDLIRFFVFYYSKKEAEQFDINSIKGVLSGVTNIRNAAAHSNPFLFDMHLSNINRTSKYISDFSVRIDLPTWLSKFNKMHDVMCVFVMYEILMPNKGSKTFRLKETKELTDKMIKRLEHLPKNMLLIELINIISKSIDIIGE